jgi:DNA invertase Pin-like site-specific DNA recombinase
MIAIYVRQSLEKVDSISLETQANYGIEICEKNKWKYKIYRDSGYSGKDTDRPAFQQLLNDIKNRLIDKVIAYRFDRISRNTVDFGNLMQMFQKYNVDFMSATENFDTSTPIGKAMVLIIMTFAQLERETIATRITDNYFARAKHGTFVGGGVPYGYKTAKIIINGKHSSVLVQDDNKVENIYNEFVKNNKSLRSITLATKLSSTTLRRILSNPFYAKADVNMYNWLKSKGYIVYNDIEDFTGKFGMQIFGKEKGKKNRKIIDISEQIAVMGRHQPLIDSNIFLLAQEKFRKNKTRKVAKKEFGKYSWTTGILKCGICGHSIGVKISRGYKYALCSRHRLYNDCDNKENYKLEELEKMLISKIRNYIANYKIELNNTEISQDLINSKNKYMIEITKINEQLENLVNAISTGTSLSNILESKIKILIEQKSLLEKNLSDIDIEMSLNKNITNTDEYQIQLSKLNNFEKYSADDQRNIIKFFVDKITITPSETHITYRF